MRNRGGARGLDLGIHSCRGGARGLDLGIHSCRGGARGLDLGIYSCRGGARGLDLGIHSCELEFDISSNRHPTANLTSPTSQLVTRDS